MDESAQVLVEFNNKANHYFFSCYEIFSKSVKNLDRQKDENVFLQQHAKFKQLLKNQLEFIAKDLLDKNHSLKNTNELNKKFADAINNYLVRFTQKSLSL